MSSLLIVLWLSGHSVWVALNVKQAADQWELQATDGSMMDVANALDKTA